MSHVHWRGVAGLFPVTGDPPPPLGLPVWNCSCCLGMPSCPLGGRPHTGAGQCGPSDCSFVQQKPPGDKNVGCSAESREKKKVGQNKHIHTQQDSRTFRLIQKHNNSEAWHFHCDRQLCEIRLLMEEKQSRWSEVKRLMTDSMLGRRQCSHRKWDQVLQSFNSTFISHSDPAEKNLSHTGTWRATLLEVCMVTGWVT